MIYQNKIGSLSRFDAMIEGIEAPIEMNRQMGQLFKNYVKTLGYKIFKDTNKFLKSTNATVILDVSDKQAQQFAEKHLDYKIDKGLDLVAKVNIKYVIGEAKWISQSGGNEDKSAKDAFGLVDGYKSNKATAINILDGYVWLDSKMKTKTPKKLRNKRKIILSALLLGKFLESLR